MVKVLIDDTINQPKVTGVIRDVCVRSNTYRVGHHWQLHCDQKVCKIPNHLFTHQIADGLVFLLRCVRRLVQVSL